MVRQEDLVFPYKYGEPYSESYLLQQILQAAGITRMTWHQLRHIHSTLLHELGVPLKVAQEQLRHATIGTTLKAHSHTIPETHRKAIEFWNMFCSQMFPSTWGQIPLVR